MGSGELEEITKIHPKSIIEKVFRFRVEIPKEEYLSKLDPLDSYHLQFIISTLERSGNIAGGRLIAVGSSVRKESGWFDLDMVVLAERGISVGMVNRKVIDSINKTGLFNMEKGEVRDEKFEPKPCFYFQPKNGGRTIHLIPATPEDSPAEEAISFNHLFLRPYSLLCRF